MGSVLLVKIRYAVLPTVPGGDINLIWFTWVVERPEKVQLLKLSSSSLKWWIPRIRYKSAKIIELLVNSMDCNGDSFWLRERCAGILFQGC